VSFLDFEGFKFLVSLSHFNTSYVEAYQHVYFLKKNLMIFFLISLLSVLCKHIFPVTISVSFFILCNSVFRYLKTNTRFIIFLLIDISL